MSWGRDFRGKMSALRTIGREVVRTWIGHQGAGRGIREHFLV